MKCAIANTLEKEATTGLSVEELSSLISAICKQGGHDAIQDTLQQFGSKQDEFRTNITTGLETAKEELSAKVMSVNNELQNATGGIKSIATEL